MDCGSYRTKVGIIDRTKTEQQPAMFRTKDTGIDHLVKHGRFENQDAVARFWQKSIIERMVTDQSDISLLMSASFGITVQDKTKVVETAFETLRVLDFDMESTSTFLASLAEKPTGVFVDIGMAALTFSVCTMDTRSLPRSSTAISEAIVSQSFYSI